MDTVYGPPSAYVIETASNSLSIFRALRFLVDSQKDLRLSSVHTALAVDHDFKNQSTGERGVDFINIVAWRGTADFVSGYFTKGSMALVEGRLQMRGYKDRDGNKRIAAEVVASNIYFGDSKRDSEPGANAAYDGPPAAPPDMGELEDDDGELPF